MCCTYLALWCEMAGATGADLAPPEPAAKPPTASNTALDAP
jgi:hypothetical protein